MRWRRQRFSCSASGGAWVPETTTFVAEDIAGPGRTCDGGGVDDNRTTPENWVGDIMPGRPATSVVTFNNAGAKAQGVMSNVLDAGDPASDYSREPAGNGGRVNLGRYGNTPEASRTAGARTGAVLIVR